MYGVVINYALLSCVHLGNDFSMRNSIPNHIDHIFHREKKSQQKKKSIKVNIRHSLTSSSSQSAMCFRVQ